MLYKDRKKIKKNTVYTNPTMREFKYPELIEDCKLLFDSRAGVKLEDSRFNLEGNQEDNEVENEEEELKGMAADGNRWYIPSMALEVEAHIYK
jgi:hypothetical protein